MSRIMCFDYGGKRTGIAVTDPLKIIATGLATVETNELFDFIRKYLAIETVELFLVGLPKNLDDTDTHATGLVNTFIKKLSKEYPAIPLQTVDERFSSSMAKQAMIDMGMKKKDRRVKGNVDIIAATILLQEFLGINH